MPTFVHISDLHFGREQPEVIEGWFKATQAIQPDVVIISGDLTQRATDKEYTAAKQFLQSLPWPAFVIPGNHDMSATDLVERFFRPWKKWEKYIQTPLEPVVKTPDYTLVGVNTARAAGWYFDWSRGRISKQQIATVQQGLQNVPETSLKIVVAHHPFWLPKESEYRDLVERHNYALDAFQPVGLDIVISGHVHSAYTQVVQGVLIVHSGTTFSNRLNEDNPNGFNVIRGDHTQLEVEFMRWDGLQFQAAEQREFRYSNGVWQQTAGLNSI